MPIRFRCEYCGQLLAIARRKAGATIACPKCDHVNVVPESRPLEEKLPEGVNAALESLRLEDWLGKAKETPRPSAGILTSPDPNVEISVAERRDTELVVLLESEASAVSPLSQKDRWDFISWRYAVAALVLLLIGFVLGVAVGKFLL